MIEVGNRVRQQSLESAESTFRPFKLPVRASASLVFAHLLVKDLIYVDRLVL